MVDGKGSSFSEAIAQALPSPSAKGITGVSPPQKLLGPHPASPGGRLLYRAGAPSPAARAAKKFDFLDTVMNTMDHPDDPDDPDDESYHHSPVSKVHVGKPVLEPRRSVKGVGSTSGELSPSLAQQSFLSSSPGSLDDTSQYDRDSPAASPRLGVAASPSTHIKGGIASMGKKNSANPELKRALTTPVNTEGMSDEGGSSPTNASKNMKPPTIQKAVSLSTAALPSNIDDMTSETSSATGGDVGDSSRPGKLTKKTSFSKSMKSMFGLGKKPK
jgi:hypothetical protein